MQPHVIQSAPRGGAIASLSLDCSQYEEHWEEIWALLSREAVAAGSIERVARYRPGSQQVGEAFLTELTEWRERFARDLVQRIDGEHVRVVAV